MVPYERCIFCYSMERIKKSDGRFPISIVERIEVYVGFFNSDYIGYINECSRNL